MYGGAGGVNILTGAKVPLGPAVLQYIAAAYGTYCATVTAGCFVGCL
jgi:hypothetical protein